MDNSTLYKVLSGMVLAIALMLCPDAVFADEDFTMCAAVMPCDESGRVLSDFRGDVCEEVYATLCAQDALNRSFEKLASCEVSTSRVETQNRRLKKRLRRLKARIARQ